MSPLATLARGYGVARSAGGESLTSVGRFSAGDRFELLLRDGRVQALTDSVERGDPQAFATEPPPHGAPPT